MTANESPSPPTRLLAKGVITVTLCTAISALARHYSGAIFFCFLFSLGYVGFLIKRTWSAARTAEKLDRYDTALIKRSGLLGAMPATALLTLSEFMKRRGIDIDHYVSGTNWGWYFFQCQAEFGFVLSFACLVMPLRHRLTPRPVWLWKTISLPFFLLYFVYVIGALTAGGGQSMAR